MRIAHSNRMDQDRKEFLEEILKATEIAHHNSPLSVELSYFLMVGFKCHLDLNKLLANTAEDRKSWLLNYTNSIAQKIFGPDYQLMVHRIGKPLHLEYKNNEQNVIKSIQIIFDWLEQHLNIQCYITSGTLLGLIRDNSFIPHDDDLDAAYVSCYTDQNDILSERQQIVDCLNIHPNICATDEGKGVLSVIHSSVDCTINIDLMTAFTEGKHINQFFLQPNVLEITDILPIKTQAFYGENINIPNKPERCLDVNYGTDQWQTPDPTFRFDYAQYMDYFDFIIDESRIKSVDKSLENTLPYRQSDYHLIQQTSYVVQNVNHIINVIFEHITDKNKQSLMVLMVYVAFNQKERLQPVFQKAATDEPVLDLLNSAISLALGEDYSYTDGNITRQYEIEQKDTEITN